MNPNGPPRLSPEVKRRAARRLRITFLRHKRWQAERIGWPALAESFTRDLRALGVEA